MKAQYSLMALLGVVVIGCGEAADQPQGEATVSAINTKTAKIDSFSVSNVPPGWEVCVPEMCPAPVVCEGLDESSCLARADCLAKYAPAPQLFPVGCDQPNPPAACNPGSGFLRCSTKGAPEPCDVPTVPPGDPSGGGVTNTPPSNGGFTSAGTTSNAPVMPPVMPPVSECEGLDEAACTADANCYAKYAPVPQSYPLECDRPNPPGFCNPKSQFLGCFPIVTSGGGGGCIPGHDGGTIVVPIGGGNTGSGGGNTGSGGGTTSTPPGGGVTNTPPSASPPIGL